MSQGFVYIASLAHSGSTLLDLLLGIHPKLVGLGELKKVLSLSAEEIDAHLHMACTCGQRSGACAFWGPFLPKLKELPASAIQQRYALLVEHFYQSYPAGTRIVDSSKYQAGLRFIAGLPDMRLNIIHLFKDVRAFASSHRKATLPEIEVGRLPLLFASKKFSAFFYTQTIKQPVYLFTKWYLRNRALHKAIAATNAPYINLSYDQLAQTPKANMDRLFEFLKLEKLTIEQLIPANSNSHIFMGNPMIGDPEKMRRIKYDDRWQARTDWQFAARLFPRIMAFNAKVVHSK